MNGTMANMELNGNHAQIRSTNMNELLVRGGKCLYKSTKQSTSAILIATMFLSLFSDSFLIEGLLHYIAPFRPF